MKKITLPVCSLTLVLLFCCLAMATHAQPPLITDQYELLIVFKPGTPKADIDALRNNLYATELEQSYGGARRWIITKPYPFILPPSAGGITIINNLTNAVGYVTGSPSVKGASDNCVVYAPPVNGGPKSPPPPPPSSSSLFPTYVTPIPPTTLYCPVNSSFNPKNNSAKIAVLDSGVSSEIFSNIIFVDGYNIIDGNTITADDNGHGTAVVGILANYNNFLLKQKEGLGYSPIFFEIMPIKVLNQNGEGTMFDLIKGIDHANKYNADIANVSIIGTTTLSPLPTYPSSSISFPTPLEIAIDSIKTSRNTLVIEAAGNTNEDVSSSSTKLFAPAGLKNLNSIVVGSVKENNTKSIFSNYSTTNVDVSCYGEDVLTVNRNGTPILATGTSFATPIVTGIAALLRSNYSTMSWSTIRNAIVGTTTSYPSLDSCSFTHGIINAQAAYSYLFPSILPLDITSFQAQNKQDKNKIDWKITNIKNVAYLSLERSSDGVSFVALQRFDKPSPTKEHYVFIDETPLEGINYYRLYVKNEDGSMQYSAVVSAVKKEAGATRVFAYPNPCNARLTIGYDSQEAVLPQAQLFDSFGRLVEAPISVDESQQQLQFNTSELPTGTYLLQLRFEDAIVYKKISLIR
jgi:subtilisin family serine protease